LKSFGKWRLAIAHRFYEQKRRSVEDKSQTVDRLDENRICLQFFMCNLKICLCPRRSDIFGKNVKRITRGQLLQTNKRFRNDTIPKPFAYTLRRFVENRLLLSLSAKSHAIIHFSDHFIGFNIRLFCTAVQNFIQFR
jgi:hypothetical protein